MGGHFMLSEFCNRIMMMMMVAYFSYDVQEIIRYRHTVLIEYKIPFKGSSFYLHKRKTYDN